MISREQLEEAAKRWWYYTVELAPGLIAKGPCPADLPYLARMIMRQANLQDTECLDLGCMEGLLQVLMYRRGARRILAADAVPHCADKMALIQDVYGASWDFREIGLMYQLDEKLGANGTFDFVNLSGVLYHVFSPLHTLASVRPLVKKNGLFVLTTNVVNEQSDVMHFNTGGKLQSETNTFWYPSIPLMEYFLRYFNFAPIDCLYSRHPSSNKVLYVEGKECGAISIVCRAVDAGAALPIGDTWAQGSMQCSWEYQGLSKQAISHQGPVSTIGYELPDVLKEQVASNGSIDVYLAVNEFGRKVVHAQREQDTYFLQLGDEF